MGKALFLVLTLERLEGWLERIVFDNHNSIGSCLVMMNFEKLQENGDIIFGTDIYSGNVALAKLFNFSHKMEFVETEN